MNQGVAHRDLTTLKTVPDLSEGPAMLITNAHSEYHHHHHDQQQQPHPPEHPPERVGSKGRRHRGISGLSDHERPTSGHEQVARPSSKESTGSQVPVFPQMPGTAAPAGARKRMFGKSVGEH